MEYYLQQLSEPKLELGDLSNENYELLRNENCDDQFMDFEWCVIQNTAGYGEIFANGFENEEGAIDYLKSLNNDHSNSGWKFYKCFRNKKEISVKFETTVTLRET